MEHRRQILYHIENCVYGIKNGLSQFFKMIFFEIKRKALTTKNEKAYKRVTQLIFS